MSVTVGAIAGVIGSSLGKIAEGAIAIIKIVASVGFALAFATAIMALVGYLESFVASSIVGEVLGVLGMCLPFNAVTVFSGIVAILTAILSFLVARRVYMLTMNILGVS